MLVRVLKTGVSGGQLIASADSNGFSTKINASGKNSGSKWGSKQHVWGLELSRMRRGYY